MCAWCGRMILLENTRFTGAEVAGVQKSRRNNGFKALYSFSSNSSAKDWSGYPIILLPSCKRQYAVVLPWLRCGQGQGHDPKAKATTPKAKAITFKAKTKADIFWPQANAKAKAKAKAGPRHNITGERGIRWGKGTPSVYFTNRTLDRSIPLWHNRPAKLSNLVGNNTQNKVYYVVQGYSSSSRSILPTNQKPAHYLTDILSRTVSELSQVIVQFKDILRFHPLPWGRDKVRCSSSAHCKARM